MICTELHRPKIQCKLVEFSGFNPPEGQTCGAWANEFVSAFGGCLDSANDVSACRPAHCYWRGLLDPVEYQVLFAFFIFNLLLVVITSKLLRFAKR